MAGHCPTLAASMSAFDDAFARVKQLVADFQANESFYLSPAYQEQEARRDFIDKFWIALGWDVNHDTQKNPFEQEVKVERKEHGHSQRRADYAFYLRPNFRDVKFHVEAKKPHGDLATADNYFQAVRYGWSSHTPIALLHDFEQFEIVDSRYMPHIDTALARNIRKYHFTHYLDPEKFAEIYWLFSHEAVANGSLEKFAATLPKKKGKAVQRGLFPGAYKSIDDAFLEDLDEHREALAKAFKNENENLDGESVTELVQRTLDRLVFLRFLEDKHIEPQNRIAYFGDQGTAWQDFIKESRRLDGIYNGIVFKEHPILDKPSFRPDDEIFSAICERLAHINSPYDFNAVPIHILGSIYERFLGKVIVTTDKRARVEEKPEVRKAGGVYYTPEYIVRYIVENTVGRLIEGKTPAQIAEMRFADIACGSGSFLLGVYDLLLRYHTKYYNEHPEKAKIGGKGKKEQKADCVERDDGLHLSLRKKREILLNNIYGVDIDAQAVEVAQLSLYLKLLQDETPGSAREHQLEFHEALLPSLHKNIVCGNSLIGTDILDGQLFAGTEERKLNPMNFEDAFPHIFKRKSWGELKDAATPLDFDLPGVPLHGSYSKKKLKNAPKAKPLPPEFAGGFDAVVGNPPYRMLQPHNTTEQVLTYLRAHFVAAEFKIDFFHLFLQRAVSLLKPGGYLSYIVPTTLLNNVYAESLRRALIRQTVIEQIAVARGQVFADADVHTSVLVFRREDDPGAKAKHRVLTTSALGEEFAKKPQFESSTSQSIFAELPGHVWNILVNDRNAQLIRRLCTQFLPLEKVASINRGLVTGDRAKYFSATKKSPDYAPIITGTDVRRYDTARASEYVLFMRPDAAGGCWDRDVHFAAHKIVVRQICEEPTASFLSRPVAVTANIFTVRGENKEHEIYLLGLINSRLAAFFWRTMFADFKASFPQVTIFSLAQLPIRKVDLADSADKSRHDRMVQLVEQMLEAKKQVAGAQTEKDRTYFENKCASLDRQIDALVYDLYGLTEAEIKIVEGA